MHAARAMARTQGRARDSAILSGAVRHLAAEVVARLVARGDAPMRPVLREALVRRLCDVATSADPLAFETMRSDLRRARISGPILADGYIPEVARRIGRDWETDALGFSGVTMAAARLQAMLRDVGFGWSADAGASAGQFVAQHTCHTRPLRARNGAAIGRAVLMILPAGEQHSLGAMVVTGQLRRLGVSVCLRIGPSEADLCRLLADRSFDAAMLSLAGEELIAPVAHVVRLMADLTDGRLRVAVGGWLATRMPDLAGLTGAAIATNDPQAALRALGCHPASPGAASQATAGVFPSYLPDPGNSVGTG